MGFITKVLSKLFNLRVLAAVVALWFLVDGPLPLTLVAANHNLDRMLLRLGLDIGQIPKPVTQVTVVHVPPVEYDRWVNDFAGAGSLQQLLARVPLSSGEALLGLVLERPLSLLQSEAESLLAEIHAGRSRTAHLHDETQTLLDRREQLLIKLRAPEVILGVLAQHPTTQTTWRVDDSLMNSYPQRLQDWLWSWPPISSTSSPVPSPIPHYPVMTTDRLDLPVLMRSARGVTPGFSLQLLLADARRTATPSSSSESPADHSASRVGTKWRRGKGIQLDQAYYPLSYNGSLVPLYGSSTGIRAPLRQLALGAALSTEDLQGWLLVGRDSSAILDQAAQTLVAMGDGAYLTTPYWWPPSMKLALLGLAVWMLLIVPLLRWRWAVSSVVALSVGLLLTNVLAQVHWGYWLPVAQLLWFMVMAAGLLMLWYWRRRLWMAMRTRADESDCRWAEHLLEKGDYLAASQTLRFCRTSERVLETLYSVGDRQARGGDYPHALDILDSLRRRRRRYRDVPQKVKTLRALVQQQQQTELASGSMGAVTSRSLVNTQALPRVAQAPRVLGRYQLQEELGRGACGTVYLGFDPRIARPVAIKTLNYAQFEASELADVKARFFREAEAAGRLCHPAIVQVFDVGETEQLAYIAMDYARGQALSHYIHPNQLLAPVEVYRIVLTVAEALAYAHAQNVVHRDVKPANVLYRDKPFQIKVTDFGIARMIDHAHTRTGEILGSPLYMAPEQLQGQKVSHSADIFSLGVTFYQMLCGQLPFNGENLATLSYDIVHNKHRSVRSHRKDLPNSATRITNMALQKKPGDRYLSAAEMAEALRKAAKRDFSVDW